MNIYSYLVTRNETDRYLVKCLGNLLPHVDGLLWYDDRSDRLDSVYDVYRALSSPKLDLKIRSNEAFSFVENEALFREDAWRAMEKTFHPQQGDWIVTLDADELLRTRQPLRAALKDAEEQGADTVRMRVHEVWTPDTEAPMVRTDGFWGGITADRACKYEPNSKFKEVKMGGGSLPLHDGNVRSTSLCDIVHYGYALEKDRQAKYARYSVRKGHSPRHISSILQPPTLAPLPPLE